MITPHNIDCQDVLDLLDDYRRQNLEPHLRVLVGEHVEKCDQCGEELRLREALAPLLSQSIAEHADTHPGDLPPRVKAAISAMTPQAGERRSHLPWMLTAAAAVLILVATLQTQYLQPLAEPAKIVSAPEQAAQDTILARQKISDLHEVQLADEAPAAYEAPPPASASPPPPTDEPVPATMSARSFAPAREAALPQQSIMGVSPLTDEISTTTLSDSTITTPSLTTATESGSTVPLNISVPEPG